MYIVTTPMRKATTAGTRDHSSLAVREPKVLAGLYPGVWEKRGGERRRQLARPSCCHDCALLAAVSLLIFSLHSYSIFLYHQLSLISFSLVHSPIHYLGLRKRFSGILDTLKWHNTTFNMCTSLIIHWINSMFFFSHSMRWWSL